MTQLNIFQEQEEDQDTDSEMASNKSFSQVRATYKRGPESDLFPLDLTAVLSHTEKSCSVSNYREFSLYFSLLYNLVKLHNLYWKAFWNK